jgi:hypothetical protein
MYFPLARTGRDSRKRALLGNTTSNTSAKRPLRRSSNMLTYGLAIRPALILASGLFCCIASSAHAES